MSFFFYTKDITKYEITHTGDQTGFCQAMAGLPLSLVSKVVLIGTRSHTHKQLCACAGMRERIYAHEWSDQALSSDGLVPLSLVSKVHMPAHAHSLRNNHTSVCTYMHTYTYARTRTGDQIGFCRAMSKLPQFTKTTTIRTDISLKHSCEIKATDVNIFEPLSVWTVHERSYMRLCFGMHWC